MPFSVYSDLSRSLSSVQFDYMHYLSVVILRSKRKTTYTGRRKRLILLCFISESGCKTCENYYLSSSRRGTFLCLSIENPVWRTAVSIYHTLISYVL